MSQDQHRLRDILAEALSKESPGERERYLAHACGEDDASRQAVESLIQAHQRAGDFLLQPLMACGIRSTTTEGPGRVIGRYKLLQQIGEGGFGSVFMAEQQEPVRRLVALKVIKAGMDTKEVVARFEAERQALALMDHPNIARVLDGGTTSSGRPYFVMDLVKGIPITDFCDQNRLPTEARLRLFLQVCAGVQHAHQKGIIHRDLKPSNVLVTAIGGEPVPKIIDFGVAKAIGQKLTERTLFTRFEQLIGTPAYMSPEQAEWGGVDIDTRSDTYSLGVLLYELLTGSTPLEKETLARAALDEVRRMIRETEPPTPSLRLRGMGQKLERVAQDRQAEPSLLEKLVRGDLDWITLHALEKDRARRYETVNGLARDIERHLNGEPVTACPPSARYRAGKFIRKHRALLASMATVFLALAAGLMLALVGLKQASLERQRAQAEARAARAVSGYLQSELLASSLQQDSNSVILAPYQMAIASLATGATNDYETFALRVLKPALGTNDCDAQRMAAEVCFLAPELPASLKRAFELTNLIGNRFDLGGQMAQGMAEYRRGNLAEALKRFEQPRRSAESFLASQANYFCAMIYFRQGKSDASTQALRQAAQRFDGCLRDSALQGSWHQYARAAIIRDQAERLILGREFSAWPDAATLSAIRQGWAGIEADLAAADDFALSNRWTDARDVLLKAARNPAFDRVAAMSESFPIKLAASFLMTHDLTRYQDLATEWLDWQRQFPSEPAFSLTKLTWPFLLRPLPKPDPSFQDAATWLRDNPGDKTGHHLKDFLRLALAYRNGDFTEATSDAGAAEQTDLLPFALLADLFEAMARTRAGDVETAARKLPALEVDVPAYGAVSGRDPWLSAICQVLLSEARQVIGQAKPKDSSAVNYARMPARFAIEEVTATEALRANWPACVSSSYEALLSAGTNREQIVDAAFLGGVGALLADDTNAYCGFSARLLSTALASTNQDWARKAIELTLLKPELQPNLARVYSLSDRIVVTPDRPSQRQLARGILEYRQGHLGAALNWFEGPRHFAYSLGLAAQAESFRAMIFQRRGDFAAATNALHRADAKLLLLAESGLCFARWHEYGRGVVIRSEAERLLFGHEVSIPLTRSELLVGRQIVEAIMKPVSQADKLALEGKWAQARTRYLEAMHQPGFSWETMNYAYFAQRVAVVCLLAGDVATHERISAQWAQWLKESPDPELARGLIKSWLIRPLPADDPLVLEAAKWPAKLHAFADVFDDEPLIRAMICYRSGDFRGALAATADATKAHEPATVGAARLFRAMALAKLNRLEEARRELQEAEREVSPYLANVAGRYWWDLAFCQLALKEAHELLNQLAPASENKPLMQAHLR